jgi:hypothetical protein
LLDFGALYPNGFDKQDRPVIILKPGGPNPHSVEARLKSYVYIMESLIKKMKPGVEKMVRIASLPLGLQVQMCMCLCFFLC